MADLFVAPDEAGPNENTQADEVDPISFTTTPPAKINPPRMLSTFCVNPVNVTFDTQEQDEQVLLFLRRSLITNLPWVISILILLLIPPFIIFFFRFPGLVLSVPNPGAFTLILFLFYYLAVVTIGFVYFITWFYNISLVTTQRVIDIDFSNLVYKNVSATKLPLVQDASFTQVGVIPSVFDYGDVLVQTAGTLDNFDFESVPHPEQVVEIIENLIGKNKTP